MTGPWTFGLTSPEVIVALRLVTITAVVALVLCWRDLGGPSAWAVGARVGALMGIGGLAALNVMVYANNVYQFFPNYGALISMTTHLACAMFHDTFM